MGQCGGAVEPSYGLINRCVLTDFVITCVDNRFQRWGVLPRLRRSFSCIGHPRRSLSLSLNDRDDGIPPRLDQRRRENARELCSGQITEWANPRVPGRSRFPSLSPSPTYAIQVRGVLSGFARQPHHISLPSHRSSPQGSRCGRAPCFPPKY